MRIQSIRFCNLNSLAGEWLIDFTDQDFLTNGIFAITGPTGSGKSTILDAICLALYGCTPRLGKVSKSANDIMTHGTGECSAEVVFSTVNGIFRCKWFQKRARGKADGLLQQPQQFLWDEHGTAIADKINDVAAKVKEITGMDFERFTQSTLLAQGRFASFLLAEGRDRAPLLEQLTGTGIYSEISAHVFRRSKEEQEKLRALDEEIAHSQVLSTEEENELREVCQKLSRDIDVFEQREKDLSSELNTLRTHSVLQKEHAKLVSEQDSLEEQIERFKPERLKLETARRALLYSGECSALIERQKEQSRDIAEAQLLSASLEPLAASAREQEELLIAEVQNLTEQKQTHANLLETLKTVRNLDIQTSERQKELDSHTAACIDTEERLTRTVLELAAHKEEMEKQQASLSNVLEWLDSRSKDEELPQHLAALRILYEQLEHLSIVSRNRAETIAEKRKLLKKASVILEGERAAQETASKELSNTENTLTELEAYRLSLLEGKSAATWRQRKEELLQCENALCGMLDDVTSHASLLGQVEDLSSSLLELDGKTVKEQALLEAEQAHMLSLERMRQELNDSITLLDRMQSYEKARLQLTDGEACPLCGALHHPFAEGSVPTPNKKKLQLQECELSIRKLNEVLLQRKSSLSALSYDKEHRKALCQEKKDAADRLLQQIRNNIALLTPSLSGISHLLEKDLTLSAQTEVLEKELAQTRSEKEGISLIVSRADELQEKAEHLRESLVQTRKHVEICQQEVGILEQKKAALQAEVAHLEAELDSGQARQEELFSSIRLEISSLGLVLSSTEDIPTLLDSLADRAGSFQKQKKKASELSESSRNLEKLCILGEQEALSLQKALQERKQEITEVTEILSALRKDRFILFENKDVDKEESASAERLKNSEQNCELSRKLYEDSRKKRDETSARLSTLENRVEERALRLEEDEKTLLSRLESEGFSSAAQCLKSCLSEEEREKLGRTELAFAESTANLQARIRENERRLNELAAIPAISEAEILEKIDEVKQTSSAMLEELGARRERLECNEAGKKNVERLLALRAEQEKTNRRWADLNDLIGSAEGKKFRNYAQELTFRILIGHANRQLSAMTERYLLVQHPHEALSLSVIDRYQADTVRTSRNLSGGESFLVSLSLALGLARMASRNVRVDSVFLDEGFGTLDEDALNMALDMLSGLRQQGKTIGIISHVQAIRERIGTQIHVMPSGNGRSRLSGPGVDNI